jgi:gamma-glutamyltranspeptidase/glutathione hydrolase
MQTMFYPEHCMPTRYEVLVVFLVSVFAMPASAQDPPEPAQGRAGAPPLVVPGRSMVISRFGIVASSSPLAASSGVQILEQGGNAIDAAIAANATTGLTEPMSFTIGGDLFAIIYIAAEKKLYGLNASGWSATGMTPEFLASKGVTRIGGAYSITVPGTVAGWSQAAFTLSTTKQK